MTYDIIFQNMQLMPDRVGDPIDICNSDRFQYKNTCVIKDANIESALEQISDKYDDFISNKDIKNLIGKRVPYVLTFSKPHKVIVVRHGALDGFCNKFNKDIRDEYEPKDENGKPKKLSDIQKKRAEKAIARFSISDDLHIKHNLAYREAKKVSDIHEYFFYGKDDCLRFYMEPKKDFLAKIKEDLAADYEPE